MLQTDRDRERETERERDILKEKGKNGFMRRVVSKTASYLCEQKLQISLLITTSSNFSTWIVKNQFLYGVEINRP